MSFVGSLLPTMGGFGRFLVQAMTFALAAAILALAPGGGWFRSTGIAECPITLQCDGLGREIVVRFERGRLAGIVVDGTEFQLDDVQLALPFILVAITFIAILGGGLFNVIFFMIISQWVQYARLVRAQVLALREREFVLAARAFGVRDLAMIRHHIVPNLLGPLVILMTLNVANNILLESSLTFLGLGVDPMIPSWGGMLADGRTYMQTAWWVSVFPGLAIMLTVLGLNLLGDWLRDHFDPKRRQL